jgi:pimeloyl-ACP methyl ester carboxylesterase
MRSPELFDVPVRGGMLRVARWAGRAGAPVVVAAHGITANHRNFSLLGDVLGDEVTLVAPDLRGRGASNALPPPYGMRAHSEDLVATLDHLGLESAVLLGHSMGGFLVPVAATLYPERVRSLVVVDGGIEIAEIPEGMTIEEFATLILGPSIERLKTTFPTREAYAEFWAQHPGLKDARPEHVQAYLDYDLVGEEPELRSGVSLDCVLQDCTSELTDSGVVGAIERVTQPMVFLYAERGVFDQTPGLYSEERMQQLREKAPQLESVRVNANHWTLLFGDGVEAVAEHVRKAVAG